MAIERDFIRDRLCREFPNISEAQIEKLAQYMEGILEWNEKVNLTAITDKAEFLEKHYIDSLAASSLAEYKKANFVLDLGTGGGFPGIPLAIMNEDKKFILMDSLSKRLKIIDELAEAIDIYNVETVHGRFEDLARDDKYREKFDAAVSRAVAEMNVLAEYALPFLKTGGSLIAYKSAGTKLDEELDSAEKAIKLLGGEFSRIKRTSKKHALVIIKKIKPAPDKYPRKAGTPKKEPL